MRRSLRVWGAHDKPTVAERQLQGAARAGTEAHIFMPSDTPQANVIECRELGGPVTLIDGLITDSGAEVA